MQPMEAPAALMAAVLVLVVGSLFYCHMFLPFCLLVDVVVRVVFGGGAGVVDVGVDVGVVLVFVTVFREYNSPPSAVPRFSSYGKLISKQDVPIRCPYKRQDLGLCHAKFLLLMNFQH